MSRVALSRVALIRDGLVVNVIEADAEFAAGLGYDAAIETDAAGPGWTWDGDAFAAPVVETPAPTLESLIEQTKARISAWLDEVVQAKGYDNIVSCASYAASSDDVFRAEAQAAIAWRDAVYRAGYQILADIPEGVTTPDDVMALLPRPEEYGWVTPQSG